MAIFTISDLHLALGVDKPMDIFGGRWTNYMEKLKANWERTVSQEDYVIIPGDISWATYLEQSIADFRFIHSLPGMKIISKGNHDYWWTTMSKLHHFLEEHHLSSIQFLHNNNICLEGASLCGARGWKCPGDGDFNAEDEKIYLRELQRLELSLKSAEEKESGKTRIAALHFPPFNAKNEPSGFVEILQKYRVDICIYGHLHGEGYKNCVTGNVEGIRYVLASADYLGFEPLKLEI